MGHLDIPQNIIYEIKNGSRMDIPQNIMLVQYIVEPEVAIIIGSLVKHVCSRGWRINLTNT